MPGTLAVENSQTVLAEIVTIDPAYVDLEIPVSAQSGSLSDDGAPGVDGLDGADISLDSPAGHHVHALHIIGDVTVNEGTDVRRLRAVVPNSAHDLLPGMYVNAVAKWGDRVAVIAPQEAVHRTLTDIPYVQVVDSSGHLVERRVSVGALRRDGWIVTQGLSDGERLVTAAPGNLPDGQPVEVRQTQLPISPKIE